MNAELSHKEALKQTLFALEAVIILAGSRLPPAGLTEAAKYAAAGRAVLDRAPGYNCTAANAAMIAAGWPERAHVSVLTMMDAITGTAELMTELEGAEGFDWGQRPQDWCDLCEAAAARIIEERAIPTAWLRKEMAP